ncbi:Alpha/Beta hydrolase protein [Lentinula aff. lateritia]|uniref:Alpha/Beta hydrolase protein n=1 Tax=Lentinula aff. lateritia TaxID=2804960 RepID=A0ACC1U079_9AGAR|nr:Alpha/Beta hydrolase protein [Lentinula aff. lateritia]
MALPPKVQLRFSEKLGLNLVLLQIPFLLLYTLLVSRWSKYNKGKPTNRLLFDRTARFVLENLSVRQLPAASPISEETYLKWMSEQKLKPVIDKLILDASLMWVGKEGMNYAIIYCHGRGYIGPLSDFQIEFWHRLQVSLQGQKAGVQLGVAVLDYSLYPAGFPTQLHQLISAITQIISSGLPPSHIFLAGDSAGANIILQLIGHLLHPSPQITEHVEFPRGGHGGFGFAGICLISPWVLSNTESKSERINDVFDLLPTKCLTHWKNVYMASVLDPSDQFLVQPNDAMDGWFKDIQGICSSVMITTGGREVLHDSVVKLYENMVPYHPQATLYVQDTGLHCDAIFDIAAKSKNPHPMEQRVFQWFYANILEKKLGGD